MNRGENQGAPLLAKPYMRVGAGAGGVVMAGVVSHRAYQRRKHAFFGGGDRTD